MGSEIVDGATEEAGDRDRGKSRSRLFVPELEGIRGIAAVFVIFTHIGIGTGQIGSQMWQQPGNGFVGAVLNRMEVGLPIFFVLSGVLLYRPFALATVTGSRKPAVGPYFWRRALRILPAYWVFTVAALLLLNLDDVTSIWHVLRPLLVLQVYQENAMPAGMEQTWSLSVEVAFYLFLPLFALLLDRIAGRVTDPARRVSRILTLLGVLVLIGFAFAAYTHLPSMGMYPIENLWPIEHVGFLAVGMALATLSVSADMPSGRVIVAYRLITRWPVACWAGAVVVFLISCVSPFGNPSSIDYPPIGVALFDDLLYLVFAVLLIAPLTVLRNRSLLLRAVLSGPLVRFVGRISYGLFLWHVVVIRLYYQWTGTELGMGDFWETVAVGLLGTAAVATASYVLVERPAMRFRPRLGKTPVDPGVAS